MTLTEVRTYYDEVHRVTIARQPGEPLGLTIKMEGECVVVSRIIDGGLIERNGLIDLGDIIVEVGGVPIESPDDLMYQVGVSGKKITFLVKKTPVENLKNMAIAQTPSLRKQINQKTTNVEQKVLCYMKALFSYDPREDTLHPCPEIGLLFFQGDILAIVNQVTFISFLSYSFLVNKYQKSIHLNSSCLINCYLLVTLPLLSLSILDK